MRSSRDANEIETWDAGRLCVNRRFADILRLNSLTTFTALDGFASGKLVRRIGERSTVRIELSTENGPQAFYLKRHGRLSIRELLKSWLRATWPVHGARPEWNAILRFHQLGIPTMTPVAFGECAGRSLLLTAALEPSVNLLDLTRTKDFQSFSGNRLNLLLRETVAIARTMHSAGLHHQDFYLNHLLLCAAATGEDRVHVIDLGRVRESLRLGRRWIVKDLAQLNYSARLIPAKLRLRFLRHYLGRRLTRQDRGLIGRIVRKSAHIDRHTVKNRL
jgi:heptose I phosphotransferase